MTTRITAVDHPSRRVVVALPQTYDEARERYESLVPEVDVARFSEMASWQATLELAEINAPHGFMRYYRSDITAAMSGSPSFWRTTQCLMGNHTIAERMFRHDPSVMLHATSGGPTKPAVRQLRQAGDRRRRARTRRAAGRTDHVAGRRHATATRHCIPVIPGVLTARKAS